MNINSFINQKKFIKSLKNFNKKKPFPYVVLDNFLKKDVAIKVKGVVMISSVGFKSNDQVQAIRALVPLLTAMQSSKSNLSLT